MPSSAVVVHTTPPLAPLPASDAESLRLLGVLRLAGLNPGVTTADWSANGKPFVALDGIGIGERYFSSLPGWSEPDAHLSSKQRADALEWAAFIEGQVTDLINHSLYSLPENYRVLAEAQLAALSFPMTHYVPQRLRGIVKARLSNVGLWGLGGGSDEPEGEKKKLEDSLVVAPGGTQAPRAWSLTSGRESAERQRKFGEEALRTRARAVFDPLVRKIGSSRYFYGQAPSSLDVALVSHLSLVLSTDLPNPLLADLLRSSYPTLVAHHDRVVKKLFPSGWPSKRIASPPALTLADEIRSFLPSWLGGPKKKEEVKGDIYERKEKEQERQLVYGRWAFFAGAGVALVTYLLASGIVQVDFGGDEDDDEEWIEVEGDDEDEDEDQFEAEEAGRAGALDRAIQDMLAASSASTMPVADDDEAAEAAPEAKDGEA